MESKKPKWRFPRKTSEVLTNMEKNFGGIQPELKRPEKEIA
jgi:hypothetical protein